MTERDQLRLEALKMRDQFDADWIAFLIGLGAVGVLLGTIVLLKVF